MRVRNNSYMAKKTKKQDNLLPVLLEHFSRSTEEMERRKTRKNGWDDVLRAYFGKLPDKWPYNVRIFDPRTRNTILEKNARLINNKLRGRLVPREDGDVIGAKINNTILEYEWDNANKSGTMIEKWALMDLQTRLFGTSFAINYWCTDEKDIEGEKVLRYEGADMKVLDNRDVFVDYTATHVRDANWVQVREWLTIDEMKEKGIYKNLDALMSRAKEGKELSGGDNRQNRYTSVVKTHRGLDDHMGDDRAFPVFEIVTEYRKGRWITFSPKYNLIIRDIKNPYNEIDIPIVQLRYYPVGDDVYGESEVESVLPLQRAINAILCGYIEAMNLSMRPPLKIANNPQVRIDTLEYGPDAKWLVGDSVNNVVEHQSGGEAVRNFNSSYSALVAAFNTAMGDQSLGVSNVGRFDPDKTATEVKELAEQQQNRDQQNQMYLEVALKEQMEQWLAMNKQFLFGDPDKISIAYRIVGSDKIKDLQALALDQYDIPDEGMRVIQDLILANPNTTDDEIQTMIDEIKVPKHPVIKNPYETNPERYEFEPKFEVTDNNQEGVLRVVPEDLNGMYDYIPDIKSMRMGAGSEMLQAKNKALEMVLNPQVGAMLQAEGTKIDIKELLVTILSDLGLNDADRLFETVQQTPNDQTGMGSPNPTGGNVQQPIGNEGMAGVPEAVPTGPSIGQMA